MKGLDQFDWSILRLMKSDARRTGEELSEKVGLSPAACLRRLQRLRKSGAIEREMAVLAPELENKGTTLIVLARMEKQNPKLMDELCHQLRRHEYVHRLFWVTGDDDVALIIDCASMEEFDQFCRAYLNDSPISGYKTMVSMREYRTDEES